MAYMQGSYTISHPHAVFYSPVHFDRLAPPQQSPYEGYDALCGSDKFSKFAPYGSMQADHIESTESLKRSRLSKEQTNVLEAQFQLDSKPNSMVKRRLAMQIKLTQTRVAVIQHRPFEHDE